MKSESPTIVTVSLLRLMSGVGLGYLGMMAGLVLLFGSGAFFQVVAMVVGGLVVLLWVLSAVREGPRVIITNEGFVSQELFTEKSYKWEDVTGPFTVIKSGLTDWIAFKLTADCKARLGIKPLSLAPFSGYDSIIGGAFRLSKAELANLLNEHRQAWLGSAPASGTVQERPE